MVSSTFKFFYYTKDKRLKSKKVCEVAGKANLGQIIEEKINFENIILKLFQFEITDKNIYFPENVLIISKYNNSKNIFTTKIFQSINADNCIFYNEINLLIE